MRWIVGLLLIVAAVLKALELYQHPSSVLGDSFSRFLTPFLICSELGLGLFAIAGLYWRQLRPLAMILFAGFACYSLLLALQGATSCGCFGQLEINPWWTLLLDSAVFAGLFLEHCTKRQDVSDGDAPARVLAKVCVVGTVMISLTLALGLAWHVAPRQTSSQDRFQTVGDLIILEPETWIGKEFPLLEHINLDILHGKWVLLLHRHDCPKCQEALPRYEQLARQDDSIQYAAIEVPPYGEKTISANHAVTSIFSGRLSNEQEWFVQTPIEIAIENGIVKAASTELPSLGDIDSMPDGDSFSAFLSSEESAFQNF